MSGTSGLRKHGHATDGDGGTITPGLADHGVITYLDGTVGAAPATPASGKLRVYAKTGKVLAVKDDTGTETVLGAGGGGGSLTVKQTGGSPSTASVTAIEAGSYTDNGGGDVTLFPQITGTNTGQLSFGTTTDLLDPSGVNLVSVAATLTYLNAEHTPASLAGAGIQLQAGTGYLGVYLSQKNSTTVQIYPDQANHHAVELVDRGASGEWHHVSSAGDVSVPALGRLRVLAAAPSSPTEGDSYYDSTLHKTRTWDGTTWQNHW